MMAVLRPRRPVPARLRGYRGAGAAGVQHGRHLPRVYRAEGAVTDPKDFTLDAARLKVTEDPGRACLYDAGHFDELAGVYRLACTSSAAVRFKVCVAATGSTPNS